MNTFQIYKTHIKPLNPPPQKKKKKKKKKQDKFDEFISPDEGLFERNK